MTESKSRPSPEQGRTDAGQPTYLRAVPADVLAYLSGVNLGSVVKVLAALNAMVDYAVFEDDLDAQEVTELVTRYVSVPKTPTFYGTPGGYGANGPQREKATREAVNLLLESGIPSDYEVLQRSVDRITRGRRT